MYISPCLSPPDFTWLSQVHSLCCDNISSQSQDSGTKAECPTNPIPVFAQKHTLLTDWVRAFEQNLHGFGEMWTFYFLLIIKPRR